MLFISRNDTHEEYSICLQIDWIVYSAAAKGVIDCYSLQELLFSQIKFCSTQTHKGLLLQKLHFQYRKNMFFTRQGLNFSRLNGDHCITLFASSSLFFLSPTQGCISCGILVSGIGARGVSSEHMENMEMFSLSPT